jgi:hypothetical protein
MIKYKLGVERCVSFCGLAVDIFKIWSQFILFFIWDFVRGSYSIVIHDVTLSINIIVTIYYYNHLSMLILLGLFSPSSHTIYLYIKKFKWILSNCSPLVGTCSTSGSFNFQLQKCSLSKQNDNITHSTYKERRKKERHACILYILSLWTDVTQLRVCIII